MSFDDITTRNINLDTINNLPYPTSDVPVVPSIAFSPGMFGYSSDAQRCFTPGQSSSLFYWDVASLPWPSATLASATSTTNFGTVTLSVPPAVYMSVWNFKGYPDTGIARITINGVSTNFDTYKANVDNFQFLTAWIPFLISGEGYQTVTINLSVNGKNGSSSAWQLSPVGNITLTAVPASYASKILSSVQPLATLSISDKKNNEDMDDFEEV